MTLDGYFHAPPSQRHKARIPFSAAPLPAPAYPFSSVRDWHDFFHHERAALTAREQQTQYDGVVAVLCEAFSDRLKAILSCSDRQRGARLVEAATTTCSFSGICGAPVSDGNDEVHRRHYTEVDRGLQA